MIKILETQLTVPHPLALQLNYAALDFNFTSWMSPANLRVLQSEQSSGHLAGLAEQKDHFKHVSPLSMVGDRKPLRRQRSWRDALRTLTSPTHEQRPPTRTRASPARGGATGGSSRGAAKGTAGPRTTAEAREEAGSLADEEDGGELALVEAIVAMAHKLGLKVVAEGVETEAQRALLLAAGCDYAQGYMLGAPMTAGELEAFALKANAG